MVQAVPVAETTRFQVRSEGRVFAADVLCIKTQDKSATVFSLPNMERSSSDSSFSRLMELLTRALSWSLLLVSGLIETSTYFQCIAACSGVAARIHVTMQKQFHRQIPSFSS